MKPRDRCSTTTITPAGEPQRDSGLVKTVLDQAGNTISYGYDPDQGFLTSALKRKDEVVVGGYDYAYSYDLMGNRTSETVNGVTTSTTYKDANQIDKRAGVDYTYDAAGNLLSGGGAVYTYNSRNQTTSLKMAGGQTQSQVYAGASQFERIEKQNGTGIYTQFGESILGMLIRKQGTGTYYTRLPDGSLLSQRTPAGTHYYLMDGLGSIVGMTDANGAVVAEYRYDPYGRVVNDTSAMPYNPWRFKSGYQSQTTLHYKFGQRWYDPQTGRWTQADPLEQPTSPGDWNRYVYVGGDPINAADPTGTFSTTPCFLALVYCSSTRDKEKVVAGCATGATLAYLYWLRGMKGRPIPSPVGLLVGRHLALVGCAIGAAFRLDPHRRVR